MSKANLLEQKIRASIPLSEAMQFSIDSLSQDAIYVTAPLAPNINIHGTGFAGSIYSLAVLTGWALCAHIMDELDIDAELVVGSASIRYRMPVTTDLLCKCLCNESQRASFKQGIESRGKGKLVLDIEVGESAELQATFYALHR